MDCLLYSISVVTLFITVILSQMITIFAQNPPRPVSRTKGIDRKLAVEEGSLAVLPCPVDRDENMFIEWSKDGSSLTVFDNRHRPTSSGSLRIIDTELTDSGMYKCSAINGFGSVEMTVQLIVFDKNGLPISTTTTAPKSTTPSTTSIAMLEIERIDEDSTSFSVDPMDSFDAISSLNPSHGPKISGSTKADDIWSDKLTLPFVIASVGATFLVLIILLLLLSYVKLRSPINPKFNQVLDRSNGLFGAANNLDHETRHYSMYPITDANSNNHSTSLNNHSTPGHASFTGLTTPSHHSHHPHQHHHSLHSTPPRQPSFPPPPPPTMPRPVNQMTPSHFTIVSHNHSNELRTVPSDKASSPVDSSVIYESPLEFDLKPNFAMKTPYGYLC